jgi:hypothetical protein
MIIPDGLDTPENFLPVTVSYTPPPEEPFWSSSQVSPHEVEFIDVWRQSPWTLPTMPHCAWERGLAELTSFLDQPHQIETLNEIPEAIDIVRSAHIGDIPDMTATCQGKPPQETNNALLCDEDVQLPRRTTRARRNRRSTEETYRQAGFINFTALSARLKELRRRNSLSAEDAAEALALSAILKPRKNIRRERRSRRSHKSKKSTTAAIEEDGLHIPSATADNSYRPSQRGF